MSWLDDILGTPDPVIMPTQEQYYADIKKYRPEYYETIKWQDPTYVREQKALAAELQRQAELAALQQQAGAAQQQYIAPPPPTEPSGPSPSELALASLESVLPSGFEANYLPAGLTSPYEQQAYGASRGKAEDVISRMLRRGTLSETGRARGVQALERQAPGIRGQLSALGSTLLEQERAGLREIAQRGRTAAAAVQPGQAFDPETYRGQVQSRAEQFKARLPDLYASSVPSGAAFEISPEAAGAVTGPQNLVYDPYAATGEQLTTGLEETEPTEPRKQRRSVF